MKDPVDDPLIAPAATAPSAARVVANNALVSMLGMLAYMSVRLFLPVYLLRHLTLEEYGIWAFCFVVIGCVGMSAFGISNVYVRWVARYSATGELNRINRLFSTGFVIVGAMNVAIMAGLWVLIPHLVGSLRISDALRGPAELMILGSCAIFLLSLLLEMFSSALEGLQKHSHRVAVGVMASLVEVVATVLFLRSGAGIHGLLYGYLIRVLVESSSLFVLARRHLPSLSLRARYFDREIVGLFLRYGSAVQVTGMLSILLRSAEKMIAGWFVGIWATGVYDLGQKFIFAATQLASPINAALLPAMSRVDAIRSPEMKVLYFRGTRSISMASGTLLGFLSVFALPIMTAWLGPRDILPMGVAILSIFALPYQLHLLTGPGSSMHRGAGHPKREMVYHLLQLVLLAVSVPVAFGLFGRSVTGVNLGVIAAMIVSQVFYYGYNNRRLGISSLQFFTRAVLPGLVPYAIAFALYSVLGAADWQTDRLTLIRQLVTAGALYAILTGLLLCTFFLTASERRFVLEQLTGTAQRGKASLWISSSEPARSPAVAAQAAADQERIIAAVSSEVKERLNSIFGPRDSVAEFIRLVPPDPPLPDSTTKLLARNAASEPLAVVLCSSPVAPGMVARNLARANAAADRLGPSLDRVVLQPLCVGEVEGVSYAAMPYCRPTSSFRPLRALQSAWLEKHVLAWLRGVQMRTIARPSDGDMKERFVKPLEQFASRSDISGDLRRSAEEAFEASRSGRWTPGLTLMHGDLWLGNFLIASDWLTRWSRGSTPFVVIDWAGSQTAGYPMFDLLCYSTSIGMPASGLRREIRAHCEILKCTGADARRSLIAALAYLNSRLEHFPRDRFVALADRCLNAFNRAAPGRERRP